MQVAALQSALQENPTAKGTALLRRRHMLYRQAQRGEFCAFADELKATPPSDAKPRGSSGGYQAKKAQCTWKQPPLRSFSFNRNAIVSFSPQRMGRFKV